MEKKNISVFINVLSSLALVALILTILIGCLKTEKENQEQSQRVQTYLEEKAKHLHFVKVKRDLCLAMLYNQVNGGIVTTFIEIDCEKIGEK